MRHPLRVWDKNIRRLFFMAIALILGLIYLGVMIWNTLSS